MHSADFVDVLYTWGKALASSKGATLERYPSAFVIERALRTPHIQAWDRPRGTVPSTNRPGFSSLGAFDINIDVRWV